MRQPEIIYAILNSKGIVVDLTTSKYIARYMLKNSRTYTIKHIKPITMKKAKQDYCLYKFQ